MIQQKIILIADSLHGNIQISSLEMKIISTQAFNRLHNIHQNSTVYLTYPSNRTKRFEHSLGVMHLSGQMFFHSIVNADEETRVSFFNHINKEINSLKNDKEFSTMLRLIVGDKIDLNGDFPLVNEPFYKLNFPSVIKKEHHYAYLLIYQSIRCTALLHDVGHPPFSHITEFALEEIWEKISSILEDKRSKRQKQFLIETKDFFANNINGIKLHEQIGFRIADRLIEFIIREEETDPIKQLFYCFIWRFVENIMNEKTTVFRDIHCLIDGSVDSDRLDYITRDLTNSGFNHGSIEYDRLVPSMKLMIYKNDYYFCPDTRALSTIEDFFNRRWRLYKYVIYHHRVVKTDCLLEKAVIALAMDYLADDADEIEREGQVLPLDISGIWKAVKEVYSDKDYFNALIQWDDSWLLSVLRHQFFMKYKHGNEEVKYQLDELLSNRKYYRSIIKRMDDFLEIDRFFVKHLEIDWNKLQQIVKKSWRPKLEHLCNQMTCVEDFELEITTNGFFLARIKDFFESISNVMSSDRPVFEETVENAIKKIANEFDTKGCI
ncbi:MAG: hypothetical protein GX273_09820, partial [Bacteroidales bacterium]|nr:hypothetical protein [Bacteroidales bacterium]